MMLQGSGWILERLYELEREKLQREEDDQRAHALKLFLRALNETEIYYGTLRESDKDRDREEELSRMWADVSQGLFIVDLELAKRCAAKARYWADPIGWSERQIEEAHIAIHEMESSLNRLLDREHKRRRARK